MAMIRKLLLAIFFCLFSAQAIAGVVFIKEDTDYQVPIKLVDATDGYTGEAGKTATDTTVEYAANGASSWTAYDDTGNFTEIANGHYWLNIGASEFASPGIFYQVRVSVSGCRDASFYFYTTYSDPSKIATTDDGSGINVTSGAVDTVTTTATATSVTNDVGITQAGADKVWNSTTRALTDKAGFTISGTTQTLDALSTHGDGTWATATGFSTHSAADIWSVGTRALTDKAGFTISGTKQTLDALNDISTTQVNAEVDTALADIHLDHLLAVDTGASLPGAAGSIWHDLLEDDGGTWRYTTNALEQAPSGGTNPNVLVSTTIASVTDQTHFTLTAGSTDDDAYKDQSIVVYDASNNDYPSVRVCTAYTGSTKTVTLDSAPDFTIISGDGVKAFVTAPGTSAPTAAQVADAVWDEDIVAAHNTADTAGALLDSPANWATATGFSTHSAADVWSVVTRALTDKAGFTISGTTQTLDALSTHGDSTWATATGFSTHAAADIWSVGTRALTDKAGFSLSAAGVDDILDEVIEGSMTLRQYVRILLAVNAGKCSGAGTATIIFRDLADSKDRVTATITSGNRTSVTLDGS